ncbi:hypothetical protein [Nitrosomonas sp. sh817]|uniref:hypothetical protein n=1 Tax=Nitrosomonas sp. sh817 TaxID=3070658 RepID=UPI0027DD0D82|nr:hypothetical protein [Nitrosomonas sp. sh817]WMJ07640.1 hypothetical protein RBH92_09350 [Nitrosomonas sp. sh817]
MKNFYSPVHLLLFVFLLGALMVLIQLELLSYAFEKLGLPPELGLIVLFLSLFGSAINLPVTRIKSDVPVQELMPQAYWGLLRETLINSPHPKGKASSSGILG